MPERLGSRQILGLHFFTGGPAEAVEAGLAGGLVVVPSAPVLLELERDPASREALVNADLVISDSGLMVLLWRMLRGERLNRISGLEYIRILVRHPAVRDGGTFWVMPSSHARDRAITWLQAQGISCTEADCYVAPMYPAGRLEDPVLIEVIRNKRPSQIVLGLGGGTQERLGFSLRARLPYKPGIHCIGAAIGFLTGDQVRIPAWADRLFLGWFVRCVFEPTRFVPRYWKARRLVRMMIRYGDRLPELAG